MAGTTTNITIASNALLLLGHETISSFEEDTAGARVAANLFDNSYDSLLTAYRWRFATVKATLAQLAVAPLNEFTYQYQLPSDMIYLISSTGGDYEIYGDKLYTNSPAVDIDYTTKVTPDKLPSYYIKTVEFYLASQFALPITGDINKLEVMNKMYEKQLSHAKYADSTQRPSDTFDDDPYSSARWS